MVKSEILNSYELVVILDAKKTSDDKDSICKNVVDVVNKAGGKVIDQQVWLEKQKLTFEIQKCTDGTYYMFQVQVGSEATKDIRSELRLNENILRYALIRSEAKSSLTATAVAAE